MKLRINDCQGKLLRNASHLRRRQEECPRLHDQEGRSATRAPVPLALPPAVLPPPLVSEFSNSKPPCCGRPVSPLWAFATQAPPYPLCLSKCSSLAVRCQCCLPLGAFPELLHILALEAPSQDSLAPAQVFSSAPQHVRCSAWFWTPSWSGGARRTPGHLCSLGSRRPRAQEQRAGQGTGPDGVGARAGHWRWVEFSRQTWRRAEVSRAEDQCVQSRFLI